MRDVDPSRPAVMHLDDLRISVREEKSVAFPSGSSEAQLDFVFNLQGRELRSVRGKVTDEHGRYLLCTSST
jgi:hypothetical protein